MANGNDYIQPFAICHLKDYFGPAPRQGSPGLAMTAAEVPRNH